MMNPYLSAELSKERRRELMARAARRAVVDGAGRRRRSLRLPTWLAWRPSGATAAPAAPAPVPVIGPVVARLAVDHDCCAEPVAS